MNWTRINVEESKRRMDELRKSGFCFKDLENDELRNSLVSALKKVEREGNISSKDLKSTGYKFDLLFGLKLYEELTLKKGMNMREASDLGIWRRISLYTIPDIVYSRVGDSDSRFWKTPRRIWLRALWLYIHLSWQGDIEKTYHILKKNTTDEIVQLVERAGKFGYRIELYREIMRQYSEVDMMPIKNNKGLKRNSDLFRKVMKLNTAKVQVIEPELVRGGVKSYVRSLFEYFAI